MFQFKMSGHFLNTVCIQCYISFCLRCCRPICYVEVCN